MHPGSLFYLHTFIAVLPLNQIPNISKKPQNPSFYAKYIFKNTVAYVSTSCNVLSCSGSGGRQSIAVTLVFQAYVNHETHPVILTPESQSNTLWRTWVTSVTLVHNSCVDMIVLAQYVWHEQFTYVHKLILLFCCRNSFVYYFVV